jgi:hypothetical protein
VSVLYIGLPFSLWETNVALRRNEEKRIAAFQRAGLPLVPVNGGTGSRRICRHYGWDDSFVSENALPDEEFLEDHVFWEDYMLLYISPGAACSDAMYQQFAGQAARAGADNGLFVAADLCGVTEPVPWQHEAHIIWHRGAEPFPCEGNCRLSLAFDGAQIHVAGMKEKVYHGTIASEEKMPVFLQSLLHGATLEEALQAGTGI